MAASLQFFLTRPGAVQTSKSRVRHGTNVPLIPVDQLPEWLHIVDVPRVLSDQHAAGLTSVGLACRPPETLEVCVLRARLPAKEEEEEEGEEDENENEHEEYAPPPPPPPPPQQQFGRRPGDFIKAQTLGTVGQAHAGKNGTEAERPAVALPEQRSLSSDLLRALDEDLAAAAAERARQRNSRAAQQPPPPPLENTLDDGQQQQQQQPQGGGGAQGDRHHPPSRCASVAASRQPVVAAAARAGLASSMHAPRVAAEHKAAAAAAPSLVKLPFSRAPGVQQQQQQPRGPPSTAEAYDPAWVRHIQGRAAAPGHGRGASYCRHWCVHGTCKWGRNCRYNHAMPATPEGLAEVGLREFPEWWAAAVGLAARGGGPGMEQQPHDGGGGNQARHRQLAGEARAPPPPRGGPPDQEETAQVRLGAAPAPPARAGVIRDDDEEALRAAVAAHGYPASMFASRSRRPAAP
ncbi:hypothetical protein RB597_009566 [Gaeumannomyces tritici]